MSTQTYRTTIYPIGNWQTEGDPFHILHCAHCHHLLLRLRNRDPPVIIPNQARLMCKRKDGFFEIARHERNNQYQMQRDARRTPGLLWINGDGHPFVGTTLRWRIIVIGGRYLQIIDPTKLTRVKCWKCGDVTQMPGPPQGVSW